MTAAAGPALELTNHHTGEILALRRIPRGGEIWLEMQGSLPPHREGPPLHVHFVEDEEGTIRAGTISAVVDGREFTAGPGAKLSSPRGAAHRWWNAGDEQLVFGGVSGPLVDLDRYLQAVLEVLNAGPAGRPSIFYLAHVALRHRQTQSVLLMPRPIQTLLFRAAVALGTLLGRYRGTAWPGCPERCTGASPAATP